MPTGPLTGALRETLALFDPGAPKTTTEAADLLDLGRRSAYERLERLVERGELETKKVGANGRVWWLPVASPPFADRTTESTPRPGEDSGRLPHRGDTVAELDEVISRIDDAFFALDDAGRLVYLNDRAKRLFRRDDAELVGRGVPEAFPGSDGPTLRRECRRALETREPVAFEEYHPPLGAWFEVRAYPSETGLSVHLRDVTERKEREVELERYETIFETIEDGVYVLDEDYRFAQVNDAYARMTGYDRETLLGAHCSLVGECVSREAAERSRTTADDDAESGVIEAEIRRADGDRLAAESKVTPLPMEDGTSEGTVGVVRDARRPHERDRELNARSERLSTLDALNRVVRDLSTAVIDQSTRTEIERTVCEGLAASDAYQFAWTGSVDTASQTVYRRTGAGDDGYLDEDELSVDPEHPLGDGPLGRAVRTYEIQVAEEAFTAEEYAEWRDHAREWDARSAAVLPIVHGGVLYGVLAVYTHRPTAFAADEREVLSYLGEVIGHAIAATEQRRALTSDEVLELKFWIPNAFDALGVPVSEDGRLTLDRSVPVGDGVYLEYGTVTADMLPVLDAFLENLPYWSAVNPLEEDTATDTTLFEVRLVDPPIVSEISALGGYVVRDVIEDGDYFTEIHLPPSAAVRRVIDVIEETYPTAQLATRRQVTREASSLLPFSQLLAERLTERQRTALEAAYFAGYYEWPRHATAQELAGSLDISAPTFHQHLRAAHRKIFEMILTDPVAN